MWQPSWNGGSRCDTVLHTDFLGTLTPWSNVTYKNCCTIPSVVFMMLSSSCFLHLFRLRAIWTTTIPRSHYVYEIEWFYQSKQCYISKTSNQNARNNFQSQRVPWSFRLWSEGGQWNRWSLTNPRIPTECSKTKKATYLWRYYDACRHRWCNPCNSTRTSRWWSNLPTKASMQLVGASHVKEFRKSSSSSGALPSLHR